MTMIRNPKQLPVFEARARVAKALAHPSRLMMLDALGEGPMCVSDLTQLVGADQSTVSRHLAVLQASGIIGHKKDGARAHYYLKTPCLTGFWQCIQSVLEQNLEEQRACVGGECDGS